MVSVAGKWRARRLCQPGKNSAVAPLPTSGEGTVKRTQQRDHGVAETHPDYRLISWNRREKPARHRTEPGAGLVATRARCLGRRCASSRGARLCLSLVQTQPLLCNGTRQFSAPSDPLIPE